MHLKLVHNSGLTEDEQDFLKYFRRLSEDQKTMLLIFLQCLLTTKNNTKHL